MYCSWLLDAENSYPACCVWWGRWAWAVPSSSSMTTDRPARFVTSQQSSGCPAPGRNDADLKTDQWTPKRRKERNTKDSKYYYHYFYPFHLRFSVVVTDVSSSQPEAVSPEGWRCRNDSWSRRTSTFPELRCVCTAVRSNSASCSFLRKRHQLLL